MSISIHLESYFSQLGKIKVTVIMRGLCEVVVRQMMEYFHNSAGPLKGS